MTDASDHFRTGTGEDVLGYAPDMTRPLDTRPVPMTPAEREIVLLKGQEFAASIKGKWLLIVGDLNRSGTPPQSPEDQVRQSCLDALNYPPVANKGEYAINVLLDSRGGSLDSAFRIVMYLSRYAKKMNVYVPRRAKSASTLIALGADCTYLSEFGELGPLDSQIPDPRDPARTISALDCYSSVEHVRRFGFDTMAKMLADLLGQPAGQIPLPQLLGIASQFALGAIQPMVQGVKALDFGTWGRSLQISVKYARILLESRGFEPQEAGEIARHLVYGYTHHPFPIDYREAKEIKLKVKLMDKEMYAGARKVVGACRGKSFVGFISEQDAKQEMVAKEAREEVEEAENIKLGPQALDHPEHS